MTDEWSECRQIIALHSKSFDLACRLLPTERRNEVSALYAWCRLCDDAIDLVPPSEHAEAIARLHDELHSVYSNAPQPSAVLTCFQHVVQRRRIPIEYPRELLEGMRMDVDRIDYRTTDDLLLYCWRVAGTVGLMMCHVLGVTHRRAASHAAHLGIAMQLTNIARDVSEDWERERLYLPSEWLTARLRQHLSPDTARQPLASLPQPERSDLLEAIRRLLTLADSYYASADQGLRFLEPRSALAIRAARLIYSEIGSELEARGYDATLGRTVVPTRRKLLLMLVAIRRFLADRRAWSAPALCSPDDTLDCSEAMRL